MKAGDVTVSLMNKQRMKTSESETQVEITVVGPAAIEAVIFDLGRVLVQVDVLKLARQVLADRPGQDPRALIERVMNDPVMAAHNTGRIGSRQFHATLCATLGLDVEYERFTQMWCGVFAPMPGMVELVDCLRSRVRLGLLSDTDPLHWGFLRKEYPFLAWFETPTLSYEVGVMKPDPRIFRLAATNVASPCERCLYIDDLPTNAAGAQAVGMQTLVFKDAQTLARDLAQLGLLDSPAL